ncbi:hypothetical protein NMBH4476_1709 [Neisseria meningitidis H44/76]|uniref:Putative membrane protein n=1 Tax=Neisseria meningitidis serogroup B / serotype 15 (strain H44/76) TaxID=909420 RepID=E6MW05_NEIMH|nr:hypothetical protein NMBH4476_1709 [Neisseria meningitidis H44/76]ADZ00159.1 hypothetical protein NMBM01240355_1672 [Neisseria meningitidis M01-240355]EFV64261.1 putative membrane protein [Neisseria meningitidis H44/76]EGC62244.1 hypothetical protein NMBCU385_1662 [Neisseria meningitidis CU385]MDM1032415.1 membrane protein [Neisseria meningitidis]
MPDVLMLFVLFLYMLMLVTSRFFGKFNRQGVDTLFHLFA